MHRLLRVSIGLCLVVGLFAILAVFSVGKFAFPGPQSGVSLADEPGPTPTLVPTEETEDTTVSTPPAEVSQPQDIPVSEATTQSTSPSTVLKILTVPVDGKEVKSTDSEPRVILDSGKLYTIRVSGVFVWGGCDGFFCPQGGPDYLRWGDAGFLTDNHFLGFSAPFWSGFVFLEVNGNRANVGPYNTNHLYSIQIPGNGNPATFRFHDCAPCYVDNAGSLRVEIVEGDDGGAFTLGAKHFQQRSMLPPNPGNFATWGGDQYGQRGYKLLPGDCGNTTDQCGCFLTSWAMILDFWGAQYGFHTNPRELNTWLRESSGYSGLNVKPQKVAEYARKKLLGKPFFYLGSLGLETPRDLRDRKLHELLKAGIPVILEVAGASHYVLAVGETTAPDGTPTWYINDPARKNRFDLYPTLFAGYKNDYTRMQWGWELKGPPQFASISVAIVSPAELLVTDPQGRRTGVDPRTGKTFDEIPDGTYYVQSIADDTGQGMPGHPVKTFESFASLDGSYTIQVIGTGSGSYILDVLAYDEVGNPTSDTVMGQSQVNSVDTYVMTYLSASGATKIIRSVQIDIKPDDDSNVIELDDDDEIEVAILSTAVFDVPGQVDRDSLTFGRTGDENSLKRDGGGGDIDGDDEEDRDDDEEGAGGTPECEEEDVDGDGLLDLVCEFRTHEADFQPGDTEGILRGKTKDGIAILGVDSVVIEEDD